MSQLLDEARAAAESFPDPETGRPIGSLHQLLGVRDGSEGRVELTLGLTSWAAPIADETAAGLAARVVTALGVESDRIRVEVAPLDRPPERIGQVGVRVKSIVAVGSGKGGVGKSTIATSIACGLARSGSKVGLLDADVYGPSIPHLLGVTEQPTAEAGKIRPIEKCGLRVMSMGLMVPAGEAVVWRGPMLHGAITQMLRDTDWGELDYLIVDMPPGTGDVALTLSQLAPLAGAVVVCTPQDVALLDAVKAIAMFRKVRTPLAGIVENMSYFECGCGARHDIFGSGGARAKAAELGVPFLGEAPIQIDVRKRGDDGDTGANFDDARIAPHLWEITRQLVRNLAADRATRPLGDALPVL